MTSTPDYTFRFPDGYRLELRRLQGDRLEMTMAVYKRSDKVLAVKEFDLDDIRPLLQVLLDTDR